MGMTCPGTASQVALELHRLRGEPLCSGCESAQFFRYLDRLEVERFGHGESKRVLLAKVRREGSRLRAEMRRSGA